MAQRLIQTEIQKQQQVQRLSAQQMLQVRLLEMPLTELEQSIAAELDDNPALEETRDELYDNMNENDNVNEDVNGDDNEDFNQQNEREEREDALDSALERLGGDDELPDLNTMRRQNDNADYEEMVYGDTTSFYDKLTEQMAEHEMTDRQREVINYLIGSLDDDGLLRKDLETICDELAIYQNLDITEKEVEEALLILQNFDPAGIGARSLQECLLLQIRRREEEHTLTAEQQEMNTLLSTVITDHFDAFRKKHWDKIQLAMELSDHQMEQLLKEIRKLNPKPGSSMGETQGRNIQQITPDFIIDTNDDGSITFSLNRGNVPELHVSSSFTDMVAAYKDNKEGMTRTAKEALLYAKEKVDKAQGFIEAIKQRRHTLYVTMKAIIDIQRRFLQDGDESDLRPMILKDIADRTGLDISTVSRVSNSKYAQTKWGTFPLRFFFSDSYTTEGGEELSTRKIKIALRELINSENKQRPMSDDALATKMKERGYPIARRTVAKYREQMNIPVARLRKN